MTANLKSQLVAIKRTQKSKDGYWFDIDNECWQLNKDIKVSVLWVSTSLDEEIASGFLNTLAYYASNYSASSTQAIVYSFEKYLKQTGANRITDSFILSYRSTLSNNQEHELGAIRPFLKKWNELGHPGVSAEVIELLYSLRLKSNESGELIKRLDPLKGPLTDMELEGWNSRVVQTYEKKKISLTNLTLALLFSHTGRRQIQISHLRIKDIVRGNSQKGTPAYLINFPRAKQHVSMFRSTFRQFAITSELWEIINSHAKHVMTGLQNQLKFDFPEDVQRELPLFPDTTVFSTISTLDQLKACTKNDCLHIKTAAIHRRIKKVAKTINLYSERTGELINISTRRFRYTIGTRAARAGFGEMVIAELLDHSHSVTARCYTENVPEHAEAIDSAVGQYLIPYAQAFVGVLADNEKMAKRGDDITSRVREDDTGLGTCGSYGFCNINVAIGCYTCAYFQPWLDAPHENILNSLLQKRKDALNVTGNTQLAASLDRSIAAAADVIRRCEERKEELANG